VEADPDHPGLGCLGWAVWNGREMVVFKALDERIQWGWVRLSNLAGY
jgi:hypothetical protein